MRIAVMDMGSSSFQLLIADVRSAGRITAVRRTRDILNLGLAAARAPRIPEELLAEAVATLRSFRRQAARAGAERVLPIATSALREAAGRHGLRAALSDAAGAPVRFLSGDEEARLMYLGVRAAVQTQGPILALDLGGGSLEGAVGDTVEPQRVASAPLGAARLTGKHHLDESIDLRRRADVERVIARSLDRGQFARVLREPAAAVAACGGTARTLARIMGLEMRSATGVHAPGARLTWKRLERITERLWRMSPEERLAVPGVAKRRAPLLPAGSLVLLRALERTDADALVVSGWGLREGCLLDAVQADAA